MIPTDPGPAGPGSAARPLLERRGGYWDGQFHEHAEETFVVTDPATGERLAELPRHGAEEATRAIRSAAAAAPPSLDERERILRGIARSLAEHRDDLAVIITRENGKPLAQARGEVDYAAGFYLDAAGRLDLLRPERVSVRAPGHAWTVLRRPAGVVGLITPWNFPLAMLAKKLSGALAAGCSAVCKPAELTPLTCVAFFALLDRLALPPGLVNLVFGDAPAIGEVLCAHPAVRVVSFTGSTAVGTRLAAQCAPHVKRVALELGGNAPFVVFADADLALAAEALVANKLRASGQTCVCANRVLVAAPVAEAFVALLVARLRRLVVGSGLDEAVQVGPLISDPAVGKVREHVEDAVARGARLVLGGAPAGRLYPPTVLVGVTPAMRCFREETFGPVFAVSTFDDEAEAIRLADDTDAGLAAYVFTADAARAERVAAAIRFGHVAINSGTGPTPEAPFGGMRRSGVGREGGADGILEFVELQTVAVAGS